jgi:CRISPR-associated protein Cas2
MAIKDPSPNPTEQTYLILYDIADPKRLRKVHQLCKSYGLPQQLSVFEARMTRRKLLTLLRELTPILNQGQDQLVCIPLCLHCRQNMTVLGLSWDLSHEQSCIII